MKLLVMGAGGLGGYFGARFAEAGHEVVFVARGQHREAIESRGLQVRSALGEVRIHPATVVEDPAAAGVADFVLIATPLQDLKAAAAAVRPAVGPGTGVLAAQNGIDKERIVAEALGHDQVMGCVAFIAAAVESPGVIAHTGNMAKLLYGELDGRDSARLEALDAAARTAPGFEGVRCADIGLEIWKKFSFFAPFAAATCRFASPIGPIRSDPERRARLRRLVDEAVAVGRAKGIAFEAGRVEEVMKLVDGLPEDMKSSTLIDLERGRPTELDWLSGALIRHARVSGVPVPETEAIHAELLGQPA